MNQIELAKSASKIQMQGWMDALAVLILGLLINVCYLGQGPLAGTEAHRTLPAHQMLTSGDWIIPRIYDHVYLAKPPLYYWVLALTEKLCGHADPFVWRLPSALCGAALAVVLYAFTRRWFDLRDGSQSGRIAGLVAGVGCCGMISLWSQNRVAEIDAINTVLCVASACCVIDYYYGPNRQRGWMLLGISLSFAGAILAKGPAGITVTFAAILAPPVLNHCPRLLARRGIWLSLLFGCAPFVFYAWLASHTLLAHHLPLDLEGIKEPGYNMRTDRLRHLGDTLLLPIYMMLFAFPLCMALPMALDPRCWRLGWDKPSQSSGMTDNHRRLIRALVGTMALACVLHMLTGMYNPRYSYVWLPLFCPLAGAVAAAWCRGVWPVSADRRVYGALTVAASIYPIVAIIFTRLSIRRGTGDTYMLLGVCVASVALTALIITLLARQKIFAAVWLFPLLPLILSLAGGIYQAAERNMRGRTSIAPALRQILSVDTKLIVGSSLENQTEALAVAGMQRVESHPADLLEHAACFAPGQWLLLSGSEYASWCKRYPNTLTDVSKLESDEDGSVKVVLARYFDNAESPTCHPSLTRP